MINYTLLAASQIGLFVLATQDTAMEPAFEITNLFLHCVLSGAICNLTMWLASDSQQKSGNDKRSFFSRLVVILLTGGVVGGMSFLVVSMTGVMTAPAYLITACGSGMTSTKTMQFISKKYSIHERGTDDKE